MQRSCPDQLQSKRIGTGSRIEAEMAAASQTTSLVDGQHELGLDRLDDRGIGDARRHGLSQITASG